MATLTATQNGNASDAATWGGVGIPSATNNTIVTNGKTIIWDLNLSDAISVTGTNGGTIKAPSTAGTYMLKLGTLTSVSTVHLEFGTVESPLPKNVKFTLDFNGAFWIDGYFTGVCTEPVRKYVNTTATVASGATTLPVDQDVTSDWGALWNPATDTVEVVVVNSNLSSAPNYEIRTVTAWTSNSITISPGLSSSKLSGSRVYLKSRNLKVKTSGTPMVSNQQSLIVGAEGTISGATSQAFGGQENNPQIVGGIYIGFAGLGSFVDGTIRDCVIVPTSTETYSGIGSCCGTIVSGVHIVGGFNGIYSSSGLIINNTEIWSCSYAINRSQVQALQGSSFRSRLADLRNCAMSVGYNVSLNATTQVDMSGMITGVQQTRIYDINGQPGMNKQFMCGGVVATDISTPLGPFDRSEKFSFTYSDKPVYYNSCKHVYRPGRKVKFRWYVKKAAASAFAVEPTLQIIDPANDPLLGGTALVTVVAQNKTGLQIFDVEYMPTHAKDIEIRVTATCGTGNTGVYVWSAIDVVDSDTNRIPMVSGMLGRIPNNIAAVRFS